MSLSHFPTILLLVGYPVFWLELYFFDTRRGTTSVLAPVLAAAFILALFLRESPSVQREVRRALRFFRRLDWFRKGFLVLGGAAGFLILIAALGASLYPPHLPQEYDALNYHYSLPRQHLILKSFVPIPWSSADLFLLPIQFGLAPYWFATEIPNKIPQFLFLAGLLMASGSLVRRFQGSPFSVGIMAAAILGSHCFGIQMGTAMLDIVMCYLFMAALESFLRNDLVMGVVEFTFFFWAKTLIPLQVFLTVGILIILFLVLKPAKGFRRQWGFSEVKGGPRLGAFPSSQTRGKILAAFFCLSLFIGGPFLVKSLYVSGTPFYPFGLGKVIINPNIERGSLHWRSLETAGRDLIGAKDSYGYGRSARALAAHFWLAAVPDKGVNNRYDYPLGLVYLLFLAPFLFLTFKAAAGKNLPLIPLFVVIGWALWWLSTQQTRFLFIPLILMFLSVIMSRMKLSKVFLSCLFLALIFNAVSVGRAQKDIWMKNPAEVLRVQDKKLLDMSRKYVESYSEGIVLYDDQEVAFAQFPVLVQPGKLPYVLNVP